MSPKTIRKNQKINKSTFQLEQETQRRKTNFAEAVLHRRKAELNLRQADLALPLSRSQAWVVELEAGKIDPRDLSNHLLEKLRRALEWSVTQLNRAASMDILSGETTESIDSRYMRLPIVNRDGEHAILGLAELFAHKQKDLFAFRDEETGALVVASSVAKPQIGEMVAIEYPGHEMKLRRFTGYQMKGIGKGLAMVLQPPYSVEDFESLPTKANMIGAVVLYIRVST